MSVARQNEMVINYFMSNEINKKEERFATQTNGIQLKAFSVNGGIIENESAYLA